MLPVRKALCHHSPFRADDAWYFVTLCATERGGSTMTDRADEILDAARHYHRLGKWFVALFLVMPDHLHAILHFPPTDCGGQGTDHPTKTVDAAAKGLAALPKTQVIPRKPGRACRSATAAIVDRPASVTNNVSLQQRPVGMAKTVAEWKHYLTRAAGLAFQRDFFDTRIRDDAHYAEKFNYICANPVRKGLVALPRDWPHVIAFDRITGEERQHR